MLTVRQRFGGFRGHNCKEKDSLSMSQRMELLRIIHMKNAHIINIPIEESLGYMIHFQIYPLLKIKAPTLWVSVVCFNIQRHIKYTQRRGFHNNYKSSVHWREERLWKFYKSVKNSFIFYSEWKKNTTFMFTLEQVEIVSVTVYTGLLYLKLTEEICTPSS